MGYVELTGALRGAVVSVVMAGLFAGCHLIFPFSVDPSDGGVGPDMALDAVTVDAPRDLPAVETVHPDAPTLDQPWLDSVPLDSAPLTPDSVPPDSVPPDSVPPDSVPPDSVPPDTVSPDTVSPLCYSFTPFSEAFGPLWTVNYSINGTPKVTATTIDFGTGVGGAGVRSNPGGLFCAPAGKGLKVAFSRYCTTGTMEVRLYDQYCTMMSKCPTPLYICKSTCSYAAATATEVCNIPASLGATKPIYTMIVYRPGGNSVAKAQYLAVDAQ